MKKLHSLLMIMVLALVVSSCSKDDEPKIDPVKSSASKGLKLSGPEGAETTLSLTFYKSDFKELKGLENKVRDGEFIMTSFIEISGIAEDSNVEITNLKLYLETDPQNSLDLGTRKKNEKIANKSIINVLQGVITEVAKKGSSTLKLYFKTTNTISTETPVDFTINLDSEFTF